MKKGILNKNKELFDNEYKLKYEKVISDDIFREEYFLFYNNIDLSPKEIVDLCEEDIDEIIKENKNPKVLVLGGCSGFESFRLKKIYPDIVAYSIDISEWAKKLGEEMIGTNIVKFTTCDMCNLKFEDNSFDIIISSHSLEHTSDLDKTMNEVCRVIKNNGIFGLGYPYKWEVDEQHVYKFEDDLPEYMSKFGSVCTGESKEHQSKLLKIRIKK